MAETARVVDYGRIKKMIRETLVPQTETGNINVLISEVSVGLAKDSTLQSVLLKLDVVLSTRASEITLSAVRDRLPPSLTSASNFKIAIAEDGAPYPKGDLAQRTSYYS